jgi:hypothetical protein
MSLDTLKSEGLKLEKTERAELAHFLIDSLLQSDEDFLLEKDEDIRQMLDARLAAFKQGKMELIDGEAFEAELRTRLIRFSTR